MALEQRTTRAPAPAPPASRPATWDLVAQQARPVALAGEQVLAVLPALAGLLPEGGLRRGTTVAVGPGPGTTSLGLALVAGASQAGAWVAGVGLGGLGLAAVAELGVALERLALVEVPPGELWATVVAALVDAFDVVLLGPVGAVRAGDARRLAARARERGAVLVGLGPLGALGGDVRLAVTATTWHGAGQGDGHLQARRVEVEATGRGRASRPRRATLWLPDAEGRVRLEQPAAPARLVPADRPDAHAPDGHEADPAWRQVG